MKIAFSGSSGSGKTTLVTFLAEKYGIPHISGSAGDLKTEEDKLILHEEHGYPGGGHSAVIKYSALNPDYGLINQQMLLKRRHELILNNPDFITDRSPADNIVYAILQVGYHPSVTDEIMKAHMEKALAAWDELDLVVYVKAVQPNEVEKNHRRVDNKYFQKTVDAAFEYWIKEYLMKNQSPSGPEVIIIDYWDLEKRKAEVSKMVEILQVA